MCRMILRIGAVFTVCAAGFYYRTVLFRVIAVLLFSGILTLILSPLCSFLQRMGITASLAACTSLISLISAVLICMLVFIPYLISRAGEIARRSLPAIEKILTEALGLWTNPETGNSILEKTGEQLSKTIPQITGMFAKGSANAASVMSQLIIGLVITYYMLKERKTFFRHLLLLVPASYRGVCLSTVHGCADALMGYLSGMVKTSLFVGGATYVCLLILRFPNALLLALFMGLFEVFPYVGPILGAVPILISAIPQGIECVLIASAMLIAVQQIESCVVGPYFTASSTSIHPLTSIVSVYILGNLFGLGGILLAVPAVVVFRCIFWSIQKTIESGVPVNLACK